LGIVCACADDIGLALRSIMSLVVVFDIFRGAELLTHRVLKPLKCILVLLSRRMPVSFSPLEYGHRFWPGYTTFEDISRWSSLLLGKFVPVWKGFQVKSEAPYLGTYLGPGAGALQWSSSTAKWAQRDRPIAATDAPPFTAANWYNSRAVTTLSFLSQLYQPPDFAVKKRAAIASEYPQDSLHSLLSQWYVSYRTVSVWEETLRFMSAASVLESEPLPFASLWLGAEWWDTHPVAHSLSIACPGCPAHHRLSSCVFSNCEGSPG